MIRKECDQATGTHFLETAGGLVRTHKETGNQARGTHKLGMAGGGTFQNTERKRPREGHSQTRDSRGRDLSGHPKKPSEHGILTDWRPQREGVVRTQKGSQLSSATHFLKSTDGGTCQDMERKRACKGHSLPVWRRSRAISRRVRAARG